MLVRRAQFGDHPGHPPVMRRRRPRSLPTSSQTGRLFSPAGSVGGKEGESSSCSVEVRVRISWMGTSASYRD